ncbi:FadR family transcriptional regulator [Streptomyces sp. IBSBF 2953]|uniref:FadR/GntR family transcriptional regulator n=1 Tax=Streptomyces TaxID=1883 RepID=UPI002119BD9A|nr:FadR/GntR family transcriptional regulator [Streptomyces scabiei]MCQ9178355.1 FadR family transcriptional regulator [Streptomyces hayashii]MDX3114535.1 FadR/GntR family transcriptional regulator [Streptomyces scabiei]
MAKDSTGRAGEPPVLKPWPKRPARLAQAVMESLTDSIVSGDIPPGSTLPVEPELCETFGVSRITVREAVKSLEAKGLVLARQGYGTTVTSPEEWNLLDPVVLAATVQHDDQLVVLDQLVDIRSTLEAQMTAQAAELATDDDLRAIERLLARLDEETAVPARFIETDVAFHDRILQASHNRLGRSIIRILHAQARTTYLYNGTPDATACERANAEHRTVAERLLARDSDGAAQAMAAHIQTAWSRRRLPNASSPAS